MSLEGLDTMQVCVLHTDSEIKWILDLFRGCIGSVMFHIDLGVKGCSDHSVEGLIDRSYAWCGSFTKQTKWGKFMKW